MNRIKNSFLFIWSLFLFFASCKDNRKEYYPTGELKAEYKIKSNHLHGAVKEYYKNGTLKEKAFYKNGELEGIKKVYYKNGKLDYETEFKNNIENGFHKDYSKEGILVAEGYFIDGKQDGITRWYFPDGKIEQEEEFKNGIPHGIYKSYYENGQIKLYALRDRNNTVFYKEYTKKGDLKDEYRLISIEFENDSIYFGEQCKAELQVYGALPEKSYLEVFLADMETDFDIPFEKILLKEGKATYTTIPDMTGRHILNARIKVDTTMFSNTSDLYVLENP